METFFFHNINNFYVERHHRNETEKIKYKQKAKTVKEYYNNTTQYVSKFSNSSPGFCSPEL